MQLFVESDFQQEITPRVQFYTQGVILQCQVAESGDLAGTPPTGIANIEASLDNIDSVAIDLTGESTPCLGSGLLRSLEGGKPQGFEGRGGERGGRSRLEELASGKIADHVDGVGVHDV